MGEEGAATSIKAKIMIVDDQQTSREISAVMLSANGYEVTTCTDCCEALRRLVDVPQDAVLVNLHMPGMERHEFLKALKDLDLENPPVRLGMASKMTAGGVSLHPELGIRRVIWKPFKGSELRQSVREALLSRGNGAAMALTGP